MRAGQFHDEHIRSTSFDEIGERVGARPRILGASGRWDHDVPPVGIEQVSDQPRRRRLAGGARHADHRRGPLLQNQIGETADRDPSLSRLHHVRRGLGRPTVDEQQFGALGRGRALMHERAALRHICVRCVVCDPHIGTTVAQHLGQRGTVAIETVDDDPPPLDLLLGVEVHRRSPFLVRCVMPVSSR